ncbi:MAG: thermonuclease family protein, partial [Chloroflexota bacterium]|nr:thermonuclease family protein [Chloroflexota bacterium]
MPGKNGAVKASCLGALVLVALAAAACAGATPERTAAPAPSAASGQALATATIGATAPPTATPQPIEPEPSPSPARGGTLAQVVRVVDGDTIEVAIGGEKYRVRYIGIDTPETVDPRKPVQCFGREASQRNRELVEGKTVELEKDVSETDDFGRLLRYVWVEGEMVNAALVRDGFAQAVSYPPDIKYQDLFRQLAREAREAGRGLWSGCLTPSPTTAAGVCDYSGTSQPVIKGNISKTSGEKIYHVPGGDFYDKTVVDEAAGERW